MFAALLSVSFVSAADNFTGDVVSIADDTLVTLDSDENNPSSNSNTFSDLNNILADDSIWNYHLDQDYTFSSDVDSNFVNGIVINRSINIYGDGHTIDAKYQSRIFNVTEYVGFYNIVFINGNSESGSAITGSNFAAVNCTFSNNYANRMGGALYGGYAKECIFEDNSAGRWGGVAYNSNLENCTFIGNYAGEEGGALYGSYVTQSQFINNSAEKYGGAIYGGSVGSSVFIGNTARYYAGAAFDAYVVDCNFQKILLKMVVL